MQNNCVMVRKADRAFDYKMWECNTVDEYLNKIDKFDFINKIKRSTAHDNSSSGTTPHSSGDRAKLVTIQYSKTNIKYKYGKRI